MNSIMRRTVRGAATGLGALALIAGAAACGTIGDLAGGGDEGDDPSVEQPAEDEGAAEGESENAESSEGEDTTAEEDSDAAGTDDAAEGDDAGAAPLSDEDLTAAGDQFFAFVQAAASGDGATACGLVIDPTTGDPITGSSLDACVDGFDSEAESAAEDEGAPLDPALADMLDRSMIEATDKGDGTAGINMMDSDSGLTMVKADDGKWYVDSEGLL